MSQRLNLILVNLILAGLLTACGQKGALYLPEPSEPLAAQQAADAERDKNASKP